MKQQTWFSVFAGPALLLTGGLAQAAETGPTLALPAEDKAAIEEHLGKGIVGEAIPAPAIADTGLYLAATPGTRSFRIVSGPDAGKTERHQLTQIRQGGGETTWKYDAGGKLVAYVTGKANGDYVLTGVADTEAGAITRYSPAEPFMLQGLAPGDQRHVKLDVKVFDLGNPDEQTHEGSLDVDYRYVGAYKVKVPAGSFDAVLVKWTFKGKVGPAAVDDTQYRFFAPNAGIVAAVEQLDVSAMLVYNRHKKISKVLVGKPK
jgi:YD repeat-containing protein